MRMQTLLDDARRVSGLPSDYAVAKFLGATCQTVSSWRHGRKYPGTLELMQLALMARRDFGQLTAEIEQEKAERAGKAAQAGAWRELLQRLGGVAAAVIVSAGLAPSNANAGAASQPAAGRVTPYTSCTVRKRRRAPWWAPLALAVKVS